MLDGNDIDTVDMLSYHVDVFGTEGVAQEAVTSKTRYASKTFKDVSSVLCNNDIPLRIKVTLYKSYV